MSPHFLISKTHDLLASLNCLSPGDSLVLGVSGGPDSMALLDIFRQLPLRLELRPVYIDHGLRPLETGEEIAMIRDYCNAHTIPFEVKSVDVPGFSQKNKKSVEDAARILRYKNLRAVKDATGSRFICTGHTRDDQVEEFFIRLFRGSGLKGLSGMRKLQGDLLRPLLDQTKKDLLDYLEEQKLSWSFDSSNSDKSYLRNKIRLQLLPLLEDEYNPGLRDNVIRLMEIMGCDDELLSDYAKKAFEAAVTACDSSHHGDSGDKILEVDGIELEKFHVSLQRRALEMCIWAADSRPSFVHITGLLQLLFEAETGKEYHLPGGVRAEKQDRFLHFYRLESRNSRKSRAEPELQQRTINSPGSYVIEELNHVLHVELSPVDEARFGEQTVTYLDASKLTFPLVLRAPLEGERVRLSPSGLTKKISRYFNEKKIPARKRKNWPLLTSGNDVLSVVGLAEGYAYRVTKETGTVLVVRWE